MVVFSKNNNDDDNTDGGQHKQVQLMIITCIQFFPNLNIFVLCTFLCDKAELAVESIIMQAGQSATNAKCQGIMVRKVYSLDVSSVLFFKYCQAVL